MLKRLAHIIVAGWLSLLLLFGSTAKEFIHLFADHEDTVHKSCNDGSLSIEPEHHHCSFLSFSLPAFDNDFSIPFVCHAEQQHATNYLPSKVTLLQRNTSEAYLRGPPAAGRS